MKVEYLKPEQIVPYEKNPRNNKEEAINKVATSISEYGIKQPIVIDKNNVIVAGHTRLEAIKKLGIEEVPCIRADDLSPAQIKAYRIMDNKSNEFAEWNDEFLDLEMQELKDLDFDLDLTGFDDYEFAGEEKEGEEDDFDTEEAAEREPKYKIEKGEVWQLGEHRLMCGDATSKEDVDKLMNGNKADMVFTDPPYNVDYGWNTFEGNPNRFKNRKIENDKLNEKDWIKFVEGYMSRILENCNGAIYIFMSNKEMYSNQNTFQKLGGTGVVL